MAQRMLIALVAAAALAAALPTAEAFSQTRREVPGFAPAPRFQMHEVDFLDTIDARMMTPWDASVKGGKSCNVCENIATQLIGNLEKILAQTVIGGGCAALCSLVPEGAQICMVACQVLGYKEFIALLSQIQGHIDPVYFCTKVHLCRTTDGGAIGGGSLTAPDAVTIGTPFQIEAKFTVTKALGAGELIFMLQPPNAPPLGSGQFEGGFAAGDVDLPIRINLQNPQQGQGPPLPGGIWTAKVMVCELTCGSPYEGAQLYDTFATQFNVTQPSM